MSMFGTGNRGIESTTIGIIVNLDTTTLIAEVDMNGTNASVSRAGMNWGVNWILSSPSTNVTYLLDHAKSTDTSTSGLVNQTVVAVPTGQSAQFWTKHNVESGQRFRVRVASSVVTATAKIIAEPLI